jgi:hypothetical protein
MFDFINQAIETEKAYKTSFEGRGLAVVTSSGAVLAILLGLASWISQEKSPIKIHGATIWILVDSAVLLMLSSALGILVSAPRRRAGPDPQDIYRFLEINKWNAEGDKARRVIARQRLRQWQGMRTTNERRGRVLRWSIILEVLGFLMIGSAVITSLILR